MLDDLLVFFIAVFSLHLLKLTTKYSRFSHLIGGIVLLEYVESKNLDSFIGGITFLLVGTSLIKLLDDI